MTKNDGRRMMGRLHCFLSAVSIASALLAQQAGAQPEQASSPPQMIASKPLLTVPAKLFPAPTWTILTPSQKIALQPLERDWDGLDNSSRSKWLSIAGRFSALPADDQARLHERMRAWARSSPAERQQARITFREAKQMAAGQREAKWEAYQALPPEKRQELADKAAQKLVAKPPPKLTAANNTPQLKSNLVPAALKGQPVKAVAPSVLQAKPGATTVLITQSKTMPAHQQAGQTKVFADPDLVDSKTLLPKRRLVAAGP